MLLRLVRDADVVLESFRPGVLDRLGVGYERLREVNPGIVYCAITGYGLDGPLRDRSGHDMNYLGLVGLLGLTGEADGPPVQAAGQIADVGGGALMAAFGILAALRERDRSGRGTGRRRLDGRRRAVLAGDDRRELPRRRRRPAPRAHPARRHVRLLPAVRVRRRLGDARRARAEVLPRTSASASGREDLIEQQFQSPGSDAHASWRRSSRRARATSGRRSPASTTAAWSRCSTSTRRSTPSSCGSARWSSRSTSRAPTGRSASSACR